MKSVIIIPARQGSTRFPGKPRAVIKGKTMLNRVWLIAKAVKNADLVFNQSIGPIGMMAIGEAHKQGVPIATFAHSIDWELAAKSIRHFRKFSAKTVRWLAQRY